MPLNPAKIAPGNEKIRRRIQVGGVVQGVGFRPYIYRLASQERLVGTIANDTSGVTIEVEGTDAAVESFLRRLPKEIPPLALVSSIAVLQIPAIGEDGFRILHSDARGAISAQIPADAATCADCLREMMDPADRRYRYPFINCTNCGPRFTITRSIPYDRPQTSMSAFPMCAPCQAEYDDPLNRRFHAQPNACWTCGPSLSLVDCSGASIAAVDCIEEVTRRILAGEILAIKGIGGFHLVVDATNEAAVMKLRLRKHRFGKPLAVMFKDADAVSTQCVTSALERSLLMRVERPIVLIHRKSHDLIAHSVAPDLPWFGAFLPYAPLHHLLFASGTVKALVMTSANLTDEPIAIDNNEALARLAQIADAFLIHDREILQRCDDSVLQIVEGHPQILRRARGFVPLALKLPLHAPPLLAVGGHLKNTFCLAAGHNAYQSQHLGDLENLPGMQFFEEALTHFKHTFEVEPEVIAHDMHPRYSSTQWAQKQNLPRLPVQHHHAHIASCMAEHDQTGRVIGLALDGTGFGTDGHIWGGEVLLCTYSEFARFGHLKYAPMPGGDAAIREPWRMAFSQLLASMGEQVFAPQTVKRLGASQSSMRLMQRMIGRGINSPMTSSCGRLFDAAAALITQRHFADYEAQAAIELEAKAGFNEGQISAAMADPVYGIRIIPGSTNWSPEVGNSIPWQLDPAPLFRAIMADLDAGQDASAISYRFHEAVAHAYVELAVLARTFTGIERLCLSGGVVHNRLLVHLLQTKLKHSGFAVYLPRLVSPGDGGLSYGQAVVAAARLAGIE